MNSQSNKQWDIIIRPSVGLFDLKLKDLWNYRDLLYLLVRRDIITVYKQTLLGAFWFILPPLLNTAIYFVLFGVIAKVSTDGTNPILFYLTGLIAWGYFADCINRTSTTFRSNANIFGKVYFPRLIVPLSSVVSALIKFGVQFLLLITTLSFFLIRGENIQPQWTYLWVLPLILFLMMLTGLAFGIIISSLTTKYRDLSNMVPFALQLMMYATPVIYPASIVPQKYLWIININPITPLIESMRFVFLGTDKINWLMLGYSALFAIFTLFVGLLLFNKTEKDFMDTV
jgi:lipopolysaccharide transport system permease protein